MEFNSVPNFPLIITKEMIEVYAQASPVAGFWDFPYGEQWMVYARIDGLSHWEVEIIEEGHWLMTFKVPNDAEDTNYGFDIWSPGRGYSHQMPCLFKDQRPYVANQWPNAVRHHFPARRYGMNKSGVFIYPQPIYGVGGFQGYAST